MKTKFQTQLTVLLLLISLASSAQEATKYDRIKMSDFSKCSPADMQYFRAELIKKLNADPAISRINGLQDSQVAQLATASRARTKTERTNLHATYKTLSPENKLKAFGIKDPKKFMEDQKTIIEEKMKLISKFPELNKLDEKDRKEILSSLGRKNRTANVINPT